MILTDLNTYIFLLVLGVEMLTDVYLEPYEVCRVVLHHIFVEISRCISLGHIKLVLSVGVDGLESYERVLIIFSNYILEDCVFTIAISFIRTECDHVDEGNYVRLLHLHLAPRLFDHSLPTRSFSHHHIAAGVYHKCYE